MNLISIQVPCLTWFPVNALKSCPQKRHTATTFLVELIVTSFTGSHSCNSIAVEKVTAYYMKWLYSDKKSTFLRKRLKSVKPCFTPLPNSEAGNLRKCYYVSINWIKRNMHWIEILYVIV